MCTNRLCTNCPPAADVVFSLAMTDTSTVVPEVQAVEADNNPFNRRWCDRGLPNEPKKLVDPSVTPVETATFVPVTSGNVSATCPDCQTHEDCTNHCQALSQCQGYSWRPDGQPRCEFHTFTSFAVGPPSEGFPQDGSTGKSSLTPHSDTGTGNTEVFSTNSNLPCCPNRLLNPSPVPSLSVEWYANSKASGCAPVKINWCGRGTPDGDKYLGPDLVKCPRSECPDLAACKARCESVWQCMGFNLVIDEADPIGCWLKKLPHGKFFTEGPPYPTGARPPYPFYANERAYGCRVSPGTQVCWCGHGKPTGVHNYKGPAGA